MTTFAIYGTGTANVRGEYRTLDNQLVNTETCYGNAAEWVSAYSEIFPNVEFTIKEKVTQ
tara:strand:- start:44 stop:223 length:180 start_codon:yes stop_codon:yes gene_type:complete